MQKETNIESIKEEKLIQYKTNQHRLVDMLSKRRTSKEDNSLIYEREECERRIRKVRSKTKKRIGKCDK